MDESVLDTAPVHYLLMYTQFSTHLDTSDTIVKITTLILQKGLEYNNSSICGRAMRLKIQAVFFFHSCPHFFSALSLEGSKKSETSCLYPILRFSKKFKFDGINFEKF